ncbi:hypothetical protein CASFOL_020826 [Castilleja foliolosa]|uniref:Protein RER1 n=1 Tax=Castilleja foliolosa TaxID=1961234 RepID=A0ABD3D4Y3_9LAMI
MGRVYAIKSRLQYYSDKLKGQFRYRWISTFVLACFYAIRVYLHGYYHLTFYVGILLSVFLRIFTSSVVREDGSDLLPVSSDAPIKTSDKFRPFVPLLPEFRFWCIVNMLFCVALSMTFIPKLNPHVPVNGIWIYFLGWLYFTRTLLQDLRYFMKKYKFFPFYYGNKKLGNTKGNNLLLVETGRDGDCLEHFKLMRNDRVLHFYFLSTK